MGDWKRTWYAFKYGSSSPPAVEMKAGETKEVYMILNFSENEAKDWSLVAWGTKGAVGVNHSKGLTSATMPVLTAPGSPPVVPAAPKPKVPVPQTFAKEEVTPLVSALVDFADSIPLSDLQYKFGDCAGGYKENWGGYSMVLKMDPACTNTRNSFTFTVKVDKSEQENLQAWYFKQDAEGHYLADSRKLLVEPCSDAGSGKLECKYKLGYYKDYIERGLSQPWQTTVAYAGDASMYGYYGISTSMSY